MLDKNWIVFAQFLVNLVLAVVTISLFIQGQRDRRRIDSDRRRDQATKISLVRHEVSERIRDEGGGFAETWSIRSTNVTVRNDSELPVTQVSVVTTERPHWNAHSDPYAPRNHFRSEQIQFPQLTSQPFGLSILPGESLVYEGEPLSPQNLRLHFTDGAGHSWVKNSTDGTLWSTTPASPALRSRIAQRITRIAWLKWLAWLIHTLPHKHADRRFRSSEAGIPWSARWIRYSWGFVPMGEPDPWDLPWGAPADEWPYDYWIDITRRHSTRQRRGPCGVRTTYRP